MPDYSWLGFMLSNYSVGELQSGIPSYKLKRTKPLDPSDSRTTRIVKSPIRIKGTGIPASTLRKIQDGIYKPGPKTISKLKSMYNRINYRELRNAGASVNKARSTAKSPRVDEYIRKLKLATRQLSDKKKVPFDVIAYYMGLSDKNIEQLIISGLEYENEEDDE